MECRKYYNEDRPHGAIGNKPRFASGPGGTQLLSQRRGG
jgi:hypothetical protein